MSSKARMTHDQRLVLARLLQLRLVEMEQQRAGALQGLTQADSAQQRRLLDADDATQQAGVHEVEGSVSDIESEQFNAIRAALQRIHEADYGLCVDCQSAIPFERLSIEPQTLRCAPCESRHERASAG